MAGIGLALGGGAALGFAHFGVLRALGELGIRASAVAGVSMGALVAAALAGGALDEAEELARRSSRWRVWREGRLALAGGLLDPLAHGARIAALAGLDRLEDAAIPLAVGSVDLLTGEAVGWHQGPADVLLGASIAVPGIFRPVIHEGRWLVDGGVVAPVPSALVRSLGVERVIAVDVLQDYAGRVSAMTGGGALAQRPPSLRRAASLSLARLLAALAESSAMAGRPDLVIRPQVGGFSVLDFD
ncbi:MAG: hypothetical protein D6757_02975, partial [Alphaproteobacteria bacterium]